MRKTQASTPSCRLKKRIDQTCDFYRARGWGKIKLVADPMTYMGVFQGVPVAFEANQTPLDHFGLSMIKPSRRLIEEFTAAGGSSFVLIEFTGCGEIYAATLPWLDATARAFDGQKIHLAEFRASEGFGRGLKQITPDMCGIPVPFGLALESLSTKERRRAASA